MARQTYYGESLSEASTTGTAWADAAAVTFTPDDDSTYFYFQSAAHALTSSSSDCLHRLLNATSSLVCGLVNAEAKDLTDYVPVFAAGVEPFTTGHGAQTIKSQISVETAGITARIREDRIVVLKKGANDDHEVSAGNSTTTSSSYQDKISRNFTPGSEGEYLIIAFCNRRSSTTGINTFCCLDIDGAIYGEAGHSVADLNTYRPWGTMVKVNLTAAAHTIKLKFRSNGTATATVNNAVLIILRLSDFVNNYYAEDRARETHNSSTFLTQASLTVSSPANQEHVVLACAQYDHGATTSSTSVRLQEVASGTTNLTEIIEEPVNAATNNVLSWFVAYRKTLAAESHTWNIQHHNESSTIVSGLKDKAIAVLQTGGDSSISQTVNLNALLEKQSILRTASAGAALQKQGLALTASVGGTLSKTLTPTSSLSAAVLKQNILRTAAANTLAQRQGVTRAASANAALAKAMSAASSLNSILQKAVLRTAAADSVLQKNVGRTASVQAALEKDNLTLAASINAAVQKSMALTASLNAFLSGSSSPQVTVSINALLQKLVQANASLDALLARLGIARSASANAILLKAGVTRAANANAVLSKTDIRTANITAVLQKSSALNAGLTALVQKLNISVSASADAALARSNITHVAFLQAALQKNIATLAAFDAVLQKQVAATAEANGLALKSDIPLTVALDGVIVVLGTATAHHTVKATRQRFPRTDKRQPLVKPRRSDTISGY